MMNRSIPITWMVLIALTLFAYFFSDKVFLTKNFILIILGITMTKFLLIGLQFMELKKANTVWKVLFTGLILLFSLFVWAFY